MGRDLASKGQAQRWGRRGRGREVWVMVLEDCGLAIDVDALCEFHK